MIWVLLIIGVVIIAALAARMLRPSPDPVDSFRRQIDALSPEARKPTVDKVRDVAEENDEPDADEA